MPNIATSVGITDDAVEVLSGLAAKLNQPKAQVIERALREPEEKIFRADGPVNNPVHVGLTPEDTGLSLPSTALTDHARFVDRSRLRGNAVGRVSAPPMALLGRHLARLFSSVRPV
jgi:predicted transcriptional regulator